MPPSIAAVADPPSGGSSPTPRTTTTFLFTDIEGSTRRWEESPGMRQQVDDHFAVLRAAVEGAGGEVFATLGDGVAAAFGSADAALHAAIVAQRRMPELGLRVRMGVHTGEVERRDGDFRGRPVNRAARIMATGHGGQVLLSDVTAALLRAGSAAVELVDLGSHRLRDLAEPERLWQVVHPDLEARFPPVRGIDTYATNLPVQRSSLVGREDDVRRVRGLVLDHRVVTLTGVGGVGKTRLAVHTAADLLAEVANAWFVDLAGVVDPDDVADAVARAVGVTAVADPLDATLAILGGERTLLVVDSCEHVVDAAAVVLDALTAGCPTLSVLATSREGLGLDGEHIVVVQPLDPAVAAVELFEQRATAAGARLADDDRSAIGALCRRLDGIPLAIELAAARAASLGLAAITGGLDDRAGPLVGRRRGPGDRHGTMRLTIEWSHRLLDPGEQRLLHWLAAFPAGFELDAALHVAAALGADEPAATDRVASLVHKSMVVVDHHGHGVRYRLLEVVRAFALERLDEVGERAEAVAALARWVTTLTDLVYAEPCSPTVERHAIRLEREADAWREAVLHAVRAADGRLAAALCGPPTAFFLLGRHDLADVVRPLLAVVGDDPRQRQAVLCALIVSAAGATDPDQLQAWADEIEATDRGAPTGLGGLMRWMALAWRGDFASAVRVCVEASHDEALAESTRDLFVGIAVLDHFSLTDADADDHLLVERALAVAERSEVALTRVACRLGAAWGLRTSDPGRALRLVRLALDDVDEAPALTRLTLPGSASRLVAQLDPAVAARGLLEQLDATATRRSFVDLIPLFYGATLLNRAGHPAADAALATVTVSAVAPYLSMMDVVDLARRAASVANPVSLVELEATVRVALAELAAAG